MKTFVILASVGIVGASMLFAKPETEPMNYVLETPASVLQVEWNDDET